MFSQNMFSWITLLPKVVCLWLISWRCLVIEWVTAENKGSTIQTPGVFNTPPPPGVIPPSLSYARLSRYTSFVKKTWFCKIWPHSLFICPSPASRFRLQSWKIQTKAGSGPRLLQAAKRAKTRKLKSENWPPRPSNDKGLWRRFQRVGLLLPRRRFQT